MKKKLSSAIQIGDLFGLGDYDNARIVIDGPRTFTILATLESVPIALTTLTYLIGVYH